MWVPFFVLALHAALCNADGCIISPKDGICTGHGDDTGPLQAMFETCPRTGQSITVLSGADCRAQPLVLISHTLLTLEKNSTIKAGPNWLPKHDSIQPFISATDASNITIRGSGILDGSGFQWWRKAALRPRLLVFQNCSSVSLEDFTLLNSGFWTLLLGGHDFKVSGIKIRAPKEGAPNTDGIDVAANGVHITGVDISNGDDGICIKSPSSNVLVEYSTVRAGNGLVVGTAADGLMIDPQWVANVSNITFRHCIADDTTFGCHIKCRFLQHGSVRNVTFDNITIFQSAESTARRVQRKTWAGYAIGIHQGNQGTMQDRLDAGPVDPPVMVTIEDVTFRNIRANGLHGGQFDCGSLWAPACKRINLEHVHLNASIDGCYFKHTIGSALDVTPASCQPPSAEASSGQPIFA